MQAFLARRSHHLRRGIEASHAGAGGNNALRQFAGAAAKIEDALTRLCSQPLHHAGSEFRHECGILFVGFWIPVLRHTML